MKKLLYLSPLFTYEGITKASRDYLSGIINKNEYSIMVSDYNYSKEFNISTDKIYNAFDIKTHDYITFFNTRPDQWSIVNYKNLFGFHVFEGDRLPKQQVKGINNSNIHCVFVPSFYCKRILEKMKVNKPIEVVPYILNKNFLPAERALDETTTFYFSGAIFGLSTTDRKGIDLVLKLWKEYENDKNKVLLLKINTFYADNVYGMRGESFNLKSYLKHLYGKKLPSNIEIITSNISDKGLIDIYNSVDCILCPTRGEGFGFIPFEGLACGIPCIVTEGLGCDTFLDDVKKGFLKIKRDGQIPAEKRYPYFDGDNLCNWEEPDFEDFKLQVKTYLANKEQYRKDALEASKILHSKYNEDTITTLLLDKVNSYLNK
jgi:glycosyltransferase involved in cell wall biosynthesis